MRGHFVDLTGKTFGKWNVIRYEGRSKWLCECQCQLKTTRIVNGGALVSGTSTSRGCVHKEKQSKMMSEPKKNLVGEKFGRLTVESYIGNSRWKCKCDCGNTKIFEVTTTRLTHGITRSCGCLRSELVTRKNKDNAKNNVYNLTEEYGIGYDSHGNRFIFDIEDYEKISQRYWYMNNYGYFISSPIGEEKYIMLHIFILGTKPHNKEIDHINRNKSDNRKSNLRFVTRAQNNQNKLRKDGTIRGICYIQQIGKWKVTIRNKTVGRFENYEEAVIARLKAEKEQYGEFSPNQKLFEKYGI